MILNSEMLLTRLNWRYAAAEKVRYEFSEVSEQR
jgi:hypothetical protein